MVYTGTENNGNLLSLPVAPGFLSKKNIYEDEIEFLNEIFSKVNNDDSDDIKAHEIAPSLNY